MSGAPLVWLAGPDELVLALVALGEGGVERAGEGWIVELEPEVFGARFAGGAGPACPELDTPCGDAEVWGAVVVAVARLDGGLDVESESLDGAGEAGFGSGERADGCHCYDPFQLLGPRPSRSRWLSMRPETIVAHPSGRNEVKDGL